MTDDEKRLAYLEAYSAAPERIIQEAVNNLQKAVGQGNASRGFHDEGDQLREQVTHVHPYAESAVATRAAALRNYYMVKLGLIITEAAEALEDLRNGHSANRNYYTIEGERINNADGEAPEPTIGGFHTSRETAKQWRAAEFTPKPEGVPSELADIVIRCLDFADEAGFSLIDAIMEKLDYNDTRQKMHGKATI